MNACTMGSTMNAQVLADVGGKMSQQAKSVPDMAFAKLLATAANAPQNPEVAAAVVAPQMTWREMQAVRTSAAVELAQVGQTTVTLDEQLAALMQVLKGLGSTEESGDNDENVLDLVMQMQERLQKLAEENGAEMAGQQLMAMLAMAAQGDVPMQAVQSQASGDAMTMLQTVLATDASEVAKLFTDGGMQNAQNQLVQQGEGEIVVLQPQAGAQQNLLAQKTPVETNAWMNDVVAVQTEVKQEAPVLDFSNAVRTVKEQLAQTETAATPQEKPKLDIDTLQKEVNAGAFLQNTALAGTQMAPKAGEAMPIPMETQITEAVQTAVNLGSETLSIKLTPGNLGEVTIRLTNTAEGMQLSIIAKNADTQKLLASQIDALKDSLRPMKVEVDTIVTERQYEMLNGQQNFGGQHERRFEEMHGAAYYGDEPLGALEAEEVAKTQMAGAPSSALDAYI